MLLPIPWRKKKKLRYNIRINNTWSECLDLPKCCTVQVAGTCGASSYVLSHYSSQTEFDDSATIEEGTQL